MISSSVMAQNTLDTASKNSGQETTAKTDTLPDIIKEYMIKEKLSIIKSRFPENQNHKKCDDF